jgi:beta-galactosidase/beta-glucuronidase
MNRSWLPPMIVVSCTVQLLADDWQPAAGPLRTRWAKDVTPDRVHPEYPRPQMVRARWQNLNGLWDYAIRPRDAAQPETYDGRILVPFPVESALSGVMKRVADTERLWYRRTFEVPAAWAGERILLHFGAVDWEATVWLNGQELATHRGGYDPFTVDVTSALRRADAQELVVSVWDPTDAGPQPRGKQVRKPEGIWYTPTTGIWQTVWLEPVPAAHITGLRITPDVDREEVEVTLEAVGGGERPDGDEMDLIVSDEGREIARQPGRHGAVRLKIPGAKLWSPDSPHLYDLRVRFNRDEVTSYFGLRKIALGPDRAGITRLMLNNQPVFMYGPLDQGFWPDGLYTAPTDEALRYDVEVTRKLGCNLARKHVKVEPERWYYWCDKLGLLVWQDMPSGDASIGPADPDVQRTPASAAQFKAELRALIDARRNHPCIVMWVPFNEGWGQFETAGIAAWIRQDDPTRLVDAASGWTDRGVGDVRDLHAYPGPAAPRPEPTRAAVLGEFGGLGLPLPGHTWQHEKNWGYQPLATRAELTLAYEQRLSALRFLVADPGLSAAVYTQTTDVESEVNGLMTYDREVVKLDAERVAAANRKLYRPPPRVTVVVPTSEHEGQRWRYTTDKPGEDWMQPDFADAAWPVGLGGFGRAGTPGAVVGTAWHVPEIWLRREFELSTVPSAPHLRVYHDEDCRVYLNGRPVAELRGYTTGYIVVSIAEEPVLRVGKNTIAAHCRQTTGGQGIDVGIVDVQEAAGER